MSLAQAPAETVVRPGESIQQALDSAGAGAIVRLTEGTYAEHLLIRHSGVTLVGDGAERTVLEPGGDAPAGIPVLTDAKTEVSSGIVVYAEGVTGFTLRSLAIKGFTGAAVYAHTTTDLHIEDVVAEDNALWGIYVRESSGIQVRGCRASGSQYGGVALSFCQRSEALIEDNETFGNAFGIFVDNASFAQVRRNRSHGNAAGVLVLNQVYPGEPEGGSTDNLIMDNELRDNGLSAGVVPDGLGDAGPPISGVGVGLIGAERTTVVGNHIVDHHPSGPSVIGGAVAMASSTEWGGGPVQDNRVLWNRITGNEPLDVDISDNLDKQYFENNLVERTSPETIEGCSTGGVR
ncbi:right-handed parallel beta-helix repeat-containing protein [Actinoalloteichus hymeniacidonis]|uniref:Right handed beta helix region n=1 Tax=Actinoalloteichus hymeniacidonis TaxID=340345 RepID=A0AAC9HMJ0_9PSEU|nr:right-handed parallel beta-helix repeat-containing protein [Actinoalloteichus hymeniacidonis]AOS61973.1 Right handed beta helix region [Actinoalloteichus hymeniacidonis]MBB5910005.1 parallel beta-helix repeat protein [Actinoalloteichus hymeniacidonis]